MVHESNVFDPVLVTEHGVLGPTLGLRTEVNSLVLALPLKVKYSVVSLVLKIQSLCLSLALNVESLVLSLVLKVDPLLLLVSRSESSLTVLHAGRVAVKHCCFQVLEQCVDEGLIRSIGISNFNSQQIQYIIDHGRIPPAACEVTAIIRDSFKRSLKMFLL